MALTPTEEAQTRQLIAQEAPLLSLASNEPTITSKLGATKVNLSQLPAASTIADADILLIRQGTADKSVAASVFKTYASPAASETVAGIVRLATDAETAAGTSRAIAVDPAGLAALQSSTTVRGLTQLATAAEAQALSNSLKAITPATLSGAFQAGNQSLITNGYQKLPGGLILQWGLSSASVAGSAVSFPIAFPNACLQIVIGQSGPNGITYQGGAISALAFTFFNTATTGLHRWLAIGF